LVVKLYGTRDRRAEKAEFAAAWLPRLATRGYPVPRTIWHGVVAPGRYAVVQTRLPGEPLRTHAVVPADRVTDEALEQILALVELQEGADATSDELAGRDFSAWQENVVFEGWGHWWVKAASAGSAAESFVERLSSLVRPLAGLRLRRGDFTHNDLNLSNILADGGRVTGVVDWDEAGFGCRAGDLVGLAFDCEFVARRDPHSHRRDVTTALVSRAHAIAGADAVAVLTAYSALGRLATGVDRGWSSARDADDTVAAGSALLELIYPPAGR
jgi:aminoglycoside phosphotransferase (APT) family kinase protein